MSKVLNAAVTAFLRRPPALSAGVRVRLRRDHGDARDGGRPFEMALAVPCDAQNCQLPPPRKEVG